MAIRITNWSVTSSNTCYSTFTWNPDMVRIRGLARNHPILGTVEVITSKVVETWTDRMGTRYVRTHSGSIYQLGRVDPVFRRWLREVVPEWDHKHPLPVA